MSRCATCRPLPEGNCACGGCAVCEPPYQWNGESYASLAAVRAAIGDVAASALPDGDVIHESGRRYGIKVAIVLVQS